MKKIKKQEKKQEILEKKEEKNPQKSSLARRLKHCNYLRDEGILTAKEAAEKKREWILIFKEKKRLLGLLNPP